MANSFSGGQCSCTAEKFFVSSGDKPSKFASLPTGFHLTLMPNPSSQEGDATKFAFGYRLKSRAQACVPKLRANGFGSVALYGLRSFNCRRGQAPTLQSPFQDGFKKRSE